MNFLGLIIVLIILGVVVSLVDMDAKFKQLIYVLVVLAVVIFILQAFGVLSGFDSLRVR